MANEDFIEVKAQGTDFEPILPRIKDWPIAQLYSDKEAFVQMVVERTLTELFQNSPNVEKLESEVARTYFSERQRLKGRPWKVDKPDEKHFWESVKKQTNDIEAHSSSEEKYAEYQSIVRTIVERYTNEISVTFSQKSYHFAKRFLSFGFASLLNAFQARNIKAIFDHRIFIQDKIKLRGDIHKIRALAQKGTVLLLPTHYSNLDSIIIAWSIHAMGLPAFIYAAGLNLYNSKLVGYFMGRLGAYKVDRRKKNPIYLETLKQFSTVSLENGCHSLIFPGGTRSRSGAIEDKLKLGLLGTAFDAQRNNIINAQQNGTEAKQIYVVPLTMSYNFVLEAKSLIRQFLKKSGAERYYFNRKDEFESRRKVMSFVFQLLRKKSDIYLSFGDPIDLFGNEIDENGNSIFKGKPVAIEDYFKSNGELKENKQRENIYTKDLGEIIAKKFLENNIVVASHLVPFLMYELLLKKLNAKDVYELFDYDDEEHFIEREVFLTHLQQLINKIFELGKEGKLKYSDEFRGSAEEILQKGVENVGVFHNNKPLKFLKNGDIASEDIELLFYYHNRMNGYNLEQYI